MTDAALLIARAVAPIATNVASTGVRRATLNMRVVMAVRRASKKEKLAAPRFWKLWRFLKKHDVLAIFSSGSSELLQALVESIQTLEFSRDEIVNERQAKQIVRFLLSAYTRKLSPNQATEIQVQTAVARMESLQHQNTVETSDAAFRNALESVPPGTREEARALLPIWPEIRQVVATYAASGDHFQTLKDWAGNPPAWLQEAPADAFLWVASLAEHRGLLIEAAFLLDKAIESGATPIAYWRLRADLLRSPNEAHAMRKVLDEYAGLHPVAEVLEKFLTEDFINALKAMKKWQPSTGSEVRLKALLEGQLRIATKEFEQAIGIAYEQLNEGNTSIGQYTADHLLQAGGLRTGALDYSLLEKSFQLAIHVRDCIRSWSGPSEGAVLTAVRAADLLGNPEEAWNLTQRDEEATEYEASHPEIQKAALRIGATIRPIEEIEPILLVAEDSLSRLQGLAIIAERRGDLDTARSRWCEAMDSAENSEDIIFIGYQLAQFGIRTDGLDKLSSSFDNEIEEIELLARLNAGVRGELEKIRSSARRSRNLTYGLISYLQRTGDSEQAGQVAVESADRWGDASLWLQGASLFYAVNDYHAASKAAQKALQMAHPKWSREKEARYLLIESLIKEEKWSEASDAAITAVTQTPDDSTAIWALVECQLCLRRAPDAWHTYVVMGGRPPPRNEREASYLLHLWSKFEASEDSLDDMLALQKRWPTSELLKVATVQAILFSSAEFSLEAREKIREHLGGLFEELPHVFRPYKFDENDVRGSLNDLVADLPDTSEVDRQIAEGRLPYGFAASIHPSPLTELLISRSSPLFANDASQFAQEVGWAVAAQTRAVVVDLTALVTLTYFEPEIADQLLGFAPKVQAPLEHRLDALKAEANLSRGSTMFLGRLPDGEASVTAITDVEATLRLTRAKRTVKMLNELQCLERREPSNIPDITGESERFIWLDGVDLALDNTTQLLWCDDANTRKLAARWGVQSFSTSALLRALQSGGLLEKELETVLQATLIQQGFVGGQEARHWVETAAELDRWAPEGAASYLAWAPTSHDPEKQIQFALKALRHNTDEPAHLSAWVEAIGHWLSRLGGREGSHGNLVILFNRLLQQEWLTASNLPFILGGIRALTRRQDLSDPFEEALRSHYKDLTSTLGHELASSFLYSLVSSTSEQDRQIAVSVIINS